MDSISTLSAREVEDLIDKLMRRGTTFFSNGLSLSTCVLSKKRSRDGGKARRDGDAADQFLSLLLEALRYLQSSSPLSANGKHLKERLAELSAVEFRHMGFGSAHVYSTDAGQPSLARVLVRTGSLWDPKHITVLDLENNLLGDGGAQALSLHILPRLTGLRRLHLASNEIQFHGAQQLAKGPWTAHMCHLEVIGLTNNNLSLRSESSSDTLDDVLVALVRPHRRTLSRLHLNHAGVTTSSAAQLLKELLCSFNSSSVVPPQIGSLYPMWDKLYIKQNKELCADDVMRLLVNADDASEVVKAKKQWIDQHIQW